MSIKKNKKKTFFFSGSDAAWLCYLAGLPDKKSKMSLVLPHLSNKAKTIARAIFKISTIRGKKVKAAVKLSNTTGKKRACMSKSA